MCELAHRLELLFVDMSITSLYMLFGVILCCVGCVLCEELVTRWKESNRLCLFLCDLGT